MFQAVKIILSSKLFKKVNSC